MTDPYVYPGTNILKNRLDLVDAEELRRLESAVYSLRAGQLTQEPLPGKYDLAHLQSFHKHLFQDIYPWAGQLRTVTIAKDQSVFCLPQHLEASAADIHNNLVRQNYLAGLDRQAFAREFAHTWADLNSLHPFREGNGRATRAFLAQLADEAGHPITWDRLDRRTLEEASIAAHKGDEGPLQRVVEQQLARREHEVARNLSSHEGQVPQQPKGQSRAGRIAKAVDQQGIDLAQDRDL